MFRGDGDPSGTKSPAGTRMVTNRPSRVLAGMGKFCPRGDGDGGLIPDGDFPVAIPSGTPPADSDLECEDLSIAVDFRPVEPSSPDFKWALPVVAAPPQIRRTPARPASTPPRQPPCMEEPVEGTPASCEGFPGEDAGGFPPSGLLSGGSGLRRRSVALRGGGRGPSRMPGSARPDRGGGRIPSSAPGSRPDRLRYGSQAESRPGPGTAVLFYRDMSGAGRIAISNCYAAATEPCSAATPMAPPCERGYTSASALLHSLL
jgi:hypothetical protein